MLFSEQRELKTSKAKLLIAVRIHRILKSLDFDVRECDIIGICFICNNLLIITEDIASEEKAEWFGDKATIKFIPLWKWLLG